MLQEANIETISITRGLQWSLTIFLVGPFVDYRVGTLTELGVLRVGGISCIFASLTPFACICVLSQVKPTWILFNPF